MRDKIVQAAKSWVNTPYHHQARIKGVGVDCAQLIAGVAIDIGVFGHNICLPQDYSPEWHLHNKEEMLLAHLKEFGCIEKSVQDTQPGDILGFKMGRCVGHLGLMLDDGTFIHAQNMCNPKRVVINTLSAEWLKRHVVTFSFPGVYSND